MLLLRQREDSINIEAGWWVVRAVYYSLVQRSPRGYMLQTERCNERERLMERVLVVNHLIHLPAPGVTFAPMVAQRRGRSATAASADASTSTSKLKTPMQILYDKDYYKLESSMSAV